MAEVPLLLLVQATLCEIAARFGCELRVCERVVKVLLANRCNCRLGLGGFRMIIGGAIAVRST